MLTLNTDITTQANKCCISPQHRQTLYHNPFFLLPNISYIRYRIRCRTSFFLTSVTSVTSVTESVAELSSSLWPNLLLQEISQIKPSQISSIANNQENSQTQQQHQTSLHDIFLNAVRQRLAPQSFY